jgi:hypothetical protein
MGARPFAGALPDARPACIAAWRVARAPAGTVSEGESIVLYTIAVVLVILWLLGYVSSYTMGGFVHVLLVIALILIVVRLLSGRKIG